ncbi:Bgt-51175 [Blumeria graminis f. sp. tritici]|uniref:Bgt-51175 n=1 Tax=Blumeria graminis f. sp. tritici TaxID=62690 RepID=A0A9X9MK28_BLUGR|nr:Bgt-51175 [Blumeria graminis f. sp. tritici]
MKLFTVANTTLLLSISVPVTSSSIQPRAGQQLAVPYQTDSFFVYCRDGAEYNSDYLRALVKHGVDLLNSNHPQIIYVTEFSYTMWGPYYGKPINDSNYVVFTYDGYYVGVISRVLLVHGEQMVPCWYGNAL